MIEISTVDELPRTEGRVFYRVDYNVPMENGVITDTTRIEETLPTLHMLRERGASVVIASHLGRPKGKRNEKYSLKPVRDKLAELTGIDVQWADDCVGEETEKLAMNLGPAQVLLVENLRFHPGEESNDAEFAKQLRKLGDYYVNDAFGSSHRAHASIVALPELYDRTHRAGGLLMAKELQFLQKVTNVSERPFVALLGGAKISGKLEVLEALVSRADTVLVGGGMANTFLASQGKKMGASLVDKESIQIATDILGGKHRAEVVLPADLVVTDSIDNPTKVRVVKVDDGIGEGELAIDIGPDAIKRYASVLLDARTIFWNGPMGVFEKEQFATGTMEMAKAVAEADAITVIGGGESVEAVKSSGYADRISHISTGGGASLEFIAGMNLPGVEVLRKGTDGSGD
jgi:3-phosphoglycerate kinase